MRRFLITISLIFLGSCQTVPDSIDVLRSAEKTYEVIELKRNLPESALYKCRLRRIETDKPFTFYLQLENNQEEVQLVGLTTMTNRFFRISWRKNHFNYSAEEYLQCPLPAAEFFRAFMLSCGLQKSSFVRLNFSDRNLDYLIDFKRVQ